MSKIYDIRRTRKTKNNKNPKIRVLLNESSGFPGVILEFTDIKFLAETTEDGSNCQVTYNIIRVPKGKYKNMADSEKPKFEKVVNDVFLDLVKDAVEDSKKLSEESKIEENLVD